MPFPSLNLRYAFGLTAAAAGALLAGGAVPAPGLVSRPASRPELVLQLSPGGVGTVHFSPDGRTLAAGTWGGARLWDSRTGEVTRVLSAGSAYIRTLAFTSGGKTLAAVDDVPRGGIVFWELPSGR